MQVWKDYQEKNKDRFLNELLDLLRIPSVSARTEHKNDMVKCAEAVKQRLLEAGADMAESLPKAIPLFMARKYLILPNQPYWFTDTTMFSHQTPSNYGIAAPSNR
jgi:hypothetical protein